MKEQSSPPVQSESVKKVHETIDELWNEAHLFLKTLGSYQSTLGNEQEVQAFIQNHLREMNMETTSFEPDPEVLSSYKNFGHPEWSYKGRPVVVGEWKSDQPKTGKSLILQGHIDVVSAEPEHLWEHDPFSPVTIDDRMYGRGVLDMKGGVASMIYAVKALQQSGIQLGADLQIQTVIEEECTGNGALALLDAGFTADGALIPEPTAHRAIKGQVGVLWVRVTVQGAGAHVERAEKAHNAINKAAYLIQSLDEYREYINARPKHSDFTDHPHPLNVNTGVIQGGDWASNVPSECTFEARVGFYPDQNPAEIQAEVRDWILAAAEKDDWLRETPPDVSFYGFSAPGFSTSTDNDLFNSLAEGHRLTTNQELESIAFTATTDIRAFEEFGIPATCYGPTGANMHGPNEYVDLTSLKTTTKTIAAFILQWCQEKEN
ncbi:ArgE/DapE family deacylase [Halobacillus naozhouensis]|uniref:ArgE/DapE family deacylase n=1 Tax=Halobacillus naozhouensis TaxID=554880 RepID=A0ABY8IZ55_9BACI|nr:ArgE/DapE family deacylase [Halobacillus naozhouensis]WFT75523.1 ArgE/DapE family deacylase [Halobacillus naozhouensis]